MQISERLKMVSGLVKYRSVADIGTDHGYLPVFLCMKGMADFCIASDVNEGPLMKASKSIERYGLQEKIKARLGAGLSTIEAGEVESCVIAGMGGMLVTEILSDDLLKAKSFKQLIVQPQHDLKFVRQFLHKNGFGIANEYMIIDSGKFYNIMDCVVSCEDESYTDTGYTFGQKLIDKKDGVLELFILKRLELLSKILNDLKSVENFTGKEYRINELSDEIKLCGEVIGYYES